MEHLFSGGSRPDKLVAVVVPMHNRKDLTSDEEISLRHLVHFLGRYDKYLVLPESLDLRIPNFRSKLFSDKFFGSVTAHIRLMLSRDFYESFQDYEYILIYHTDALVFSDQLLRWCESKLDYIGPPWLKCPETPWMRGPKVGNGGFSLRKVSSFLQILDSDKYAVDPDEYWSRNYASAPILRRGINLPKKYLKRLSFFNGIKREVAGWSKVSWRNEDHFWSDRGRHYYPDFRIADFAAALQFGFEAAPRRCFELNGRQLPFGCHAWPKYDRAFWEPYLLKG
jgi:hypothetical protein